MLSPRAIARILDAATTPAISLFSRPSPSTPSSSPSTSLPLLSLSPLFLLHQPTRPRLHGPSFPHLFTHDPRGSLFADDHGCRLSSFFLLTVSLCFLTTSTATAFLSSLSTTGPRCRPWLFTVAAPPSASSSLFADDHTTAPFSAFFCVFSTSVAVVAAFRSLPFPLLLHLPNAAAPVSSLPHLLSFFSYAPPLTSPSAHASPLSLLFCTLLPPLLPTAASVADVVAIPHHLPLSTSPVATVSILRRSPPPTTLTSAPPDLVRQTPRQSPLRACKPLIFGKVFLHRVQDGLHCTWGFARS